MKGGRDDGDDGEATDPWGTGINRKTYFVCNCLGDDWIELPKITPNKIKLSENITKYLTGDLNAPVSSTSQFPGKEKHLLRAFIYRITSETYVAPVGYYHIVEGEDFLAYTRECE